jgi:hypothetical protein
MARFTWQQALAVAMVAFVAHSELPLCGAVRILASSTSSVKEAQLLDASHDIVSTVGEAHDLRFGFLTLCNVNVQFGVHGDVRLGIIFLV